MREGILESLLEQGASATSSKAKLLSKKLSQGLKRVKNVKVNAKLMLSVLGALEPHTLNMDGLKDALNPTQMIQ
eukprot:1176062-Prorocentrum_lima.AAC.1